MTRLKTATESNKKLIVIYTLIIAGAVILDQLVKYAALVYLKDLPGQSIVFIEGFMNFTYVENTGAAFGIFDTSTLVLAIISTALAAGVIYLLYRFRDVKSWLFRLSLCFIAGGALGNVLDRFFRGYVVDMLEFDFVDFAIFNVADSFVTIGAVMLGIFVIWFWDKSKKAKSEDEPNEE